MNIIIYEIILYGDPIARMYIIFFWPTKYTRASRSNLDLIFDYGMRKVFGNGEC